MASTEGQAKIREIVTAQILASLEAGTAPWHKAWSSGTPKNFQGRNYRGINVFILGMAPYTSPFWGTINHKGTGSITKAGGKVREGESPTTVIFWKRFVKTVENEESGKRESRAFFTLQYFRVFNAEQCDGLPAKFFPAASAAQAEHPEAAVVAKEYFERPGAPSVSYGGEKAYYSSQLDHIQVPLAGDFEDDAYFQHARFHEMAHSTGHKDRLNRKFGGSFGTELYGKEELAAEMTATMLLAETGLKIHFDNNAAYIQNWISAIKGDDTNKLVLNAAAQAQKAADYILGTKFDSEDAN
jgi:antirestriction protein ArdC